MELAKRTKRVVPHVKVFVITLADAAERQENAARQLKAANIDFQFVPAVAGEDAVNSDVCAVDEREFLLNTGEKVTPAEVGRFVSHRLVWKMCTNLNEPILIMQDDFLLSKDFNFAVQLVAESLQECGLIGLQSEQSAKKQMVRRQDRFTLWRYTKAPNVATCYGISPFAARKLVEFADVISAPVDVYLKRSWRHGQQMFGISPYAVAEGGPGARTRSQGRSKAGESPIVESRGILNRVRRWLARSAQSRVRSERV